MGWDRKLFALADTPKPPVLARWFWAAVVAVLVCALLFVLHVSGRVSLLQALDAWVLSGVPLMVWLLAFGARAYAYGRALSHHQFLEERAQEVQKSWQGWAQRSMAVSASCLLLPEQVSASVLTQGPSGLPSRTGQARRITALPEGAERTQAGLQMLIHAMASAIKALPSGQLLRVTLLSDVDPGHYDGLREVLRQAWSTAISRTPPATICLAGELSYSCIDENLTTASAAIELVLVLQVHGQEAYSDGLAALLLCPDSLALAMKLPISASLLRPMPLNIGALDSELPLFLHTQKNACQAVGVLADGSAWQPLIGELLAVAGAHGASLNATQQWIQEGASGLPGPFGHWLVAALGVEVARHQHAPLLVLAQEKSKHWVGTVITGELA